MLAYRLIAGISIVKPRSFCPFCKKTIAWYDNIPVFSWLFLLGKCRFCKNRISWLYPFTELLTTILLAYLYCHTPQQYFFSYFIFVSALIVTVRTDIETMLISRCVTIFLVPLALLFSFFEMIPLTYTQCLLGAFAGYSFLYSINALFKYCTNKDGIGEGDFDLLCFIGAFTGILGCWASITIGSTIGSFFGLTYMAYGYCTQKTVNPRIPFGPFLAIGAIFYVFFQKQILYVLLNV